MTFDSPIFWFSLAVTHGGVFRNKTSQWRQLNLLVLHTKISFLVRVTLQDVVFVFLCTAVIFTCQSLLSKVTDKEMSHATTKDYNQAA